MASAHIKQQRLWLAAEARRLSESIATDGQTDSAKQALRSKRDTILHRAGVTNLPAYFRQEGLTP